MTNLSQLLEEAVADHTSSTDLPRVDLHARRRARRRRATTSFVAIAVFLSAAWFGWEALRPEREVRSGGAAASGTYVLSDFEVGPHRDPRTDEIDPSVVDVSFSIMWSMDVYPGVHECQVRVYDSRGDELGSLGTTTQSLSERADGKASVPIERLDGGPEEATADGSCSPERLDAPVAYTINDVHVRISASHGLRGLEVAFRVGSPEDLPAYIYPGTNRCQAAVFTADGDVLGRSNLSVTVPPGEQVVAGISRDIPSDLSADTLNANVVCAPFTGEDGFPDATQGARIDGTVTAKSIMGTGGPLGEELARDLRLTLESGFSGSCSYFVEVEDGGVGYCLEGVAGDDRLDQYVIGEALRGHVVTEKELAQVEATLRDAGSL
jgi:hypothetical protein